MSQICWSTKWNLVETFPHVASDEFTRKLINKTTKLRNIFDWINSSFAKKPAVSWLVIEKENYKISILINGFR